MTDPPVIRAGELTKRFGTLTAVDQVSSTIGREVLVAESPDTAADIVRSAIGTVVAVVQGS